jgi:chromosome segregation ATPase
MFLSDNISKLEYIKKPIISSAIATQYYNYNVAISKKNIISDKINNIKQQMEIYTLELHKQKYLLSDNSNGDDNNNGNESLDVNIKKYELELEGCMTNITEYYKLYTTELRNQDKYENIYKEYNKNVTECKLLEDEHLKLEQDILLFTNNHNENITKAKDDISNYCNDIYSWLEPIQHKISLDDPELIVSFKLNINTDANINNINIIYISLSNDINKLQEEYKILNMTYNDNVSLYNEKEKELVQVEYERKQKIYELEQLKIGIEKESTLLDSITSEYKKYKDFIIPNIDDKIEHIYKNIHDTEVYIECASKCLVFTERKNKLKGKYNDVIESHKYLTGLNKYRKICIDVECKKLQATVNSINAIMNDALDMLFDENMSVYIKLYKKIKSNGRIKPSVNLQIMYKGYEIDSLIGLSGGEGDRVSLSLAIAMSRNSKSPFLLLDETMASVGESLRSKSINTMRNVLQSSKTILCVGHIDTEGNYDHVMKLDVSK